MLSCDFMLSLRVQNRFIKGNGGEIVSNLVSLAASHYCDSQVYHINLKA